MRMDLIKISYFYMDIPLIYLYFHSLVLESKPRGLYQSSVLLLNHIPTPSLTLLKRGSECLIKHFLKYISFIFMCIRICLNYVCVSHVCRTQGGQKKVSDALELE